MNYKVYNNDCVIGMQELQNNTVDAIITDPPYNIARDNNFKSILTLIYNSIKDSKIDALEYEVAYLLDIIFDDHGDVVLRAKDEDIRKIKEELDKRMK